VMPCNVAVRTTWRRKQGLVVS